MAKKPVTNPSMVVLPRAGQSPTVSGPMLVTVSGPIPALGHALPFKGTPWLMLNNMSTADLGHTSAWIDL
jgi:hypothetical protein